MSNNNNIDSSPEFDPQSPPNSPGLVVKGRVTSTNEKIDEFALTPLYGDNSWTYKNNEENSNGSENGTDSPIANPSLNDKSNRISRNSKIRSSSGNGGADEDGDFSMFTISSDSYFSHHRGSLQDTSSNGSLRRTDNRRTSDVSARSDGGSVGSCHTESDNEYVRTPSSGKRKKKGNSSSRLISVSPRVKGVVNNKGNDMSTMMKMMLTAEDSTDNENSPRPRSRSRSRSRSRNNNVGEKETEISQTAQIFKNLLILEESMRQQHMQQKRLRYKYTIFLVIMLLILISTIYASFFYYDDDSSLNQPFLNGLESFPILGESLSSSGDGNKLNIEKDSVGEYVKIISQIISIINFFTLILFYLSGEYNRTISRPRKFLVSTNKGIRQLNIRLVKVRVKTFDRIICLLEWMLLIPFKLLKYIMIQLCNWINMGITVRFRNWLMEYEMRLESNTSRRGVDDVKIILNPRVFSTATREQWELYRNQFWSTESKRRRELLQVSTIKKLK